MENAEFSFCVNFNLLQIFEHASWSSDTGSGELVWYGGLHEPSVVANTIRERSGSVVECLTRDRGAVGSSLNGSTALWS